jgi:transcriptional regulator with XRE-family HTH domain
MTVGEKIQFYRKEHHLSQEELGQKLLVSRQTVSLWEMDKTMPTVDNLLLLKEIFGVTVDELLSGDEPAEEKREAGAEAIATAPLETYVFQYTVTDLREVFKSSRAPLIRRGVIFAAACAILFVFLAAADAGDPLLGMLLGWFALGMVGHIRGIAAYGRAWKTAEKRAAETTYAYDVYDGYLMLTLSRGGEIMRTQKVYFDDIKSILPGKRYMILQISGEIYIVKRDELISDSAFLTLSKRASAARGRAELKKTTGALKTASILLAVLSYLTIMGALMAVAVLTGLHHTMPENMWVFYLFLPIPVGSILLGFRLKRKGYRYHLNVITGFIMAGLLCLYGSFSFMFAGVYSHGEEPILRVEQMLGIDVPSHIRINTQDWTQGTQNVKRGYMISTSDIFFSEDVAEVFERDLAGDERWMAAVPSEMVGIMPYMYAANVGDYCILYNVASGELNRLPDESGTYRFICVMYDEGTNSMVLAEYELAYTQSCDSGA